VIPWESPQPHRAAAPLPVSSAMVITGMSVAVGTS
jgi:hypothetical protein